MSRATVRNQVSLYVTQGQLPDINQVFTSFPNRIDFQVGATAGQQSRCAVVVFIERESETRIAFAGKHNGVKRVDYDIALQLFHHSLASDARDAMVDFDRTIDAMKDWLRADHNFGDPTGTIIWQAAEPSLNIEYGEPQKVNGGATETWCSVRFAVTEMINA